MTDIFDRAQELEQRQRETALARQAEAARRRGGSLSHCYDCGYEIPPLRREKVPGCTRCVECQAAAEKAMR
ncbi:TraR/DksA family transcriptional regulator [Craterilacuibacter sinensis]|uniref:TraR/DksA family transcriptional regulator n=1 Tax=Craterilacuibacter sinensis TaxID=2686017 RepID=A0A845BRJ4_9NEIS|nr:TraR/DksA family transcriptional regulator [Craterilacuibacter sinensis]MXR38020.1 TraR/DksA family transcriptional regulator [Craterilacuibacter sinensis]